MGAFTTRLIVVALLLFWLSQLLALTNMKNDEFPGKHDKILWFVAVLVGSFAGWLAFLLWRTMRSGETMSERIAREICGLTGMDQEQEKSDGDRFF